MTLEVASLLAFDRMSRQISILSMFDRAKSHQRNINVKRTKKKSRPAKQPK